MDVLVIDIRQTFSWLSDCGAVVTDMISALISATGLRHGVIFVVCSLIDALSRFSLCSYWDDENLIIMNHFVHHCELYDDSARHLV